MLKIACLFLVLGSIVFVSENLAIAAGQAEAGAAVPGITGTGESESSPALGSGSTETIGKTDYGSEENTLWGKMAEGFHYSVRVLGYGIYRDVVNSPLTYAPVTVSNVVLPYYATTRVNPNLLSNYQVEGDLRPDLFWNYDRIELMVKPRFETRWEDWTIGPLKGSTRTEGEAFVNEWLARIRFQDNLFLSYGRENLQWGPAYLISPSNPFIRDNGKNNPYQEVGGTDFARAVWVLSSRWSVSAIANIAQGQQDPVEGFNRSYALKIDYTGDKQFFSLIPQGTETKGGGVGYFGGWHLTDALLAYSEGRVLDDFYQVLVGQSYTFKSGEMISVEYYHNTRGSTVEPFNRAFPPFGNTFLDEPLLRTNYILVQFLDNGIKGVFNVTLRWIGDLDDGSTRTIAILEYELGSHAKLFTVASYDSGSPSNEFGSVVKFFAQAGVQYTF